MSTTRPPHSDHSAWLRGVLAQYEQTLVAYAMRLVGDLDRARDIVQETFLRLCKQTRSDVEPRLAEWLFTVCRNHALDVQRKESRMTSIDGVSVEGGGPNVSPAAALEARDTADHVLALISRLPAKQQEVLRLKFEHGLSYAEIGRVMGESVGNVGWLIHAGIRTVRGQLTEKGAGA